MVDQSADGRDGLFLASEEGYDVMVIDRMLPRVDGLAIVKTVRAAGVKAPVLILTTLGGVNDRVEGLEAGADDYLVKPFAFAELLARVNALARRPPITAEEAGSARRRPGDEPPQAHGHPRGPAHRAAAAGIQAARVPDAQCRPGRDPHHAARKRLGVPFRSRAPAWSRPTSAGCAPKSTASSTGN